MSFEEWLEAMSKTVDRFTFALRMTPAGRFIAELQRKRRNGNVCSETEQRLRHAFRTFGGDAPESTFTTAIASEIDRVEGEVATLRKMRSDLFGGG
jgi:hypothetical protein